MQTAGSKFPRLKGYRILSTFVNYAVSTYSWMRFENDSSPLFCIHPPKATMINGRNTLFFLLLRVIQKDRLPRCKFAAACHCRILFARDFDTVSPIEEDDDGGTAARQCHSKLPCPWCRHRAAVESHREHTEASQRPGGEARNKVAVPDSSLPFRCRQGMQNDEEDGTSPAVLLAQAKERKSSGRMSALRRRECHGRRRRDPSPLRRRRGARWDFGILASRLVLDFARPRSVADEIQSISSCSMHHLD